MTQCINHIIRYPIHILASETNPNKPILDLVKQNFEDKVYNSGKIKVQ